MVDRETKEGAGSAVRHAVRRTAVDANQNSIVEALRKAGAHVYILGFPYDLLIRYRQAWHLIEVKQNNGTFTAAQQKDMAELEAMEHGQCPVVVARTVEDALWAIGVCKHG